MKPEECEGCHTITENLTLYDDYRGPHWICDYCGMGVESDPVKSMAAMFHVLERRLKEEIKS